MRKVRPASQDFSGYSKAGRREGASGRGLLMFDQLAYLEHRQPWPKTPAQKYQPKKYQPKQHQPPPQKKKKKKKTKKFTKPQKKKIFKGNFFFLA